MADPPGPKPVIEPKPDRCPNGDSGVMNGFLDVGTVVSLALTAAFLLAGTALPFLSHHRKEQR